MTGSIKITILQLLADTREECTRLMDSGCGTFACSEAAEP
jgi:hypothetical protein